VSTPAISTDTAAATPGPFRRLAGRLFGDDGLSFRDVLDLVNPLHHIPVVGNVYRELTGDTLAPGIRVAGGALFGGPLGAALSVAGLAIDRARDASATDAPGPAAGTIDSAVADGVSASVPRGGWLLAALSTPAAPAQSAAPAPPAAGLAGPRRDEPATPALSSRVPDAARERRGGWLLAAAYARHDLDRPERRVTDRA
jgi:hypothetical protein